MTHAQDDHAPTDDSESSNSSPIDQEQQSAPTETTTNIADRLCAVAAYSFGPLLLVFSVSLMVHTFSPADASASESILLLVFAFLTFFSIASVVFSVLRLQGGLFLLLPALTNVIAFILIFARLDWVLSMRDHHCFTEPLNSRTDALYFAVTNLSSGGPGNISPATALCKQLIVVQVSLGYILTTVLLAVAVSVLIDRMAARRP